MMTEENTITDRAKVLEDKKYSSNWQRFQEIVACSFAMVTAAMSIDQCIKTIEYSGASPVVTFTAAAQETAKITAAAGVATNTIDTAITEAIGNESVKLVNTLGTQIGAKITVSSEGAVAIDELTLTIKEIVKQATGDASTALGTEIAQATKNVVAQINKVTQEAAAAIIESASTTGGAPVVTTVLGFPTTIAKQLITASSIASIGVAATNFVQAFNKEKDSLVHKFVNTLPWNNSNSTVSSVVKAVDATNTSSDLATDTSSEKDSDEGEKDKFPTKTITIIAVLVVAVGIVIYFTWERAVRLFKSMFIKNKKRTVKSSKK